MRVYAVVFRRIPDMSSKAWYEFWSLGVLGAFGVVAFRREVVGVYEFQVQEVLA